VVGNKTLALVTTKDYVIFIQGYVTQKRDILQGPITYIHNFAGAQAWDIRDLSVIRKVSSKFLDHTHIQREIAWARPTHRLKRERLELSAVMLNLKPKRDG
jgi:hypothetical protein